MKTFDFIRDVDHSGISGTGRVAQGIAFDDGVCAMHWLTDYRSTAIYPDIDTLVAIHGHNGDSRIEWHD